MVFLYIKSVEPDQMQRSAASYMDLHCLYINTKKGFQLKKDETVLVL